MRSTLHSKRSCLSTVTIRSSLKKLKLMLRIFFAESREG
jgi:hypothetical protein